MIFLKNLINFYVFKFPAVVKKCPDPVCPPGFIMKPKKSRKSKMMTNTRFSDDEDEDDKPQHQYYYIKAKYQASYEAILPISTSKDRQDINSEECFEFICIPVVDSGEIPPEYGQENQTAIKCLEPKCPRGYMMKLQIQKTGNECAKYVNETFFTFTTPLFLLIQLKKFLQSQHI